MYLLVLRENLLTLVLVPPGREESNSKYLVDTKSQFWQFLKQLRLDGFTYNLQIIFGRPVFALETKIVAIIYSNFVATKLINWNQRPRNTIANVKNLQNSGLRLNLHINFPQLALPQIVKNMVLARVTWEYQLLNSASR